MAIKQRILAKLGAIESGMQQVMMTRSKETLAVVAQELAVAREICRQGLPESSYAKYGEVYDGLILASQQIAAGEALDSQGNVLSLCQELLQHLAKETETEQNFKTDAVRRLNVTEVDFTDTSSRRKDESFANEDSKSQKNVEAVRMMIANHKVVKETEEFGLPHLLSGLRKGGI